MKTRLVASLSKEAKGLNVIALAIGCLLISVIAGILCILDIYAGSTANAIATGITSVWFLINLLLLLCKHKGYFLLSCMTAGYAAMMFCVVTGGMEGMSIVWLLVVPPAAMYCFSFYYGLIFSVILGVSMMVYLWTPLIDLGYRYSEMYQERFPLMYAFVTFLCAVTQYQVYQYRQQQDTLIDKLEYANHSKNDFLANMSHEIRTPMNAIVGMCELILRDDINDTVRENCFNIQSASRSLLSIINDILDFSKIESGKAELIEEPFNIGSTINDVINMAMTRKGDKKLEIIVRVDPEIPKGLIGDEVRIRQVMINLLTNAVKFTKKGCVVVKITQTRQDYGINLNVSVKDTGIGITKENQEKLFTSFQQVDTKKNRSVEGTGLGLAISKKLITKMGGFINVISTYGEGSEFKFVIPLKVSDAEPFIVVKEKEDVNVAIYLDMQKYAHPRIPKQYEKMIRELGEKFRIDFTIYDTVEELKQGLSSGVHTHCFTAKDEYLRNAEWFSEIAEQLQLIVIQERLDAIELPDNIKNVFKPFYALTFAAIMNNEKFVLGYSERRSSVARFIAPEAKVLVVDDNAVNLKVAAGLMKPYNMKIFTASNGPEAIDFVQREQFDIIFMDHMMPEMDGVEATQIIRNLPGEYYKNVPIIALTANAISGAREMFLGAGFNDFLAKPIEISVLDRELRTWLPEKYLITQTTKVSEEAASNRLNALLSGELVDYKVGLMYSGDNMENYLDLLSIYASSGDEYKNALNARFEAHDWKNYTIVVHGMKSSSLSVGAKSLSELAKRLESAGKEGNFDVIRNEHATLIALLEKVIEEIENYLQEKKYEDDTCSEIAEEELHEITMEAFLTQTQRIVDACDNFDADEIVALAEELCVCKVQGQSLNAYFVEVKKQAEDFEYAKASETTSRAVLAIKGGES